MTDRISCRRDVEETISVGLGTSFFSSKRLPQFWNPSARILRSGADNTL